MCSSYKYELTATMTHPWVMKTSLLCGMLNWGEAYLTNAESKG